MIDKDLVDALTTDLIAALGRQRVAEGLERRAALELAEAEEAIEDVPEDQRDTAERDKAGALWQDALTRLEEAREARAAIEEELSAIDPAAVHLAYLRHSRSGAGGDG